MKKYILLLFSVFAFGQASNQMVTFTEVQSLGFSLKSGQSHVTSSQCMTKNDALVKYNIDTYAMSSYASNQLVPRSAWVSAVPSYSHLIGSNGFSDSSIGCFDVPEEVTRYSNDNILAIGSILYTDVRLTTVFNGFGQWFKISGNLMAHILTSGEIANIIDCSPGETVSSYTYMISKGTIAIGPNATCLVHDLAFLVYSDSSVISLNMFFYANKELTIRFNGNNTTFYYASGNQLLRIDGYGFLNKINNCN